LGVEKGWRDEDIAQDMGADLQTVHLARDLVQSSRRKRDSAVSEWLEIGSSSAED